MYRQQVHKIVGQTQETTSGYAQTVFRKMLKTVTQLEYIHTIVQKMFTTRSQHVENEKNQNRLSQTRMEANSGGE